MKLVKIISGIIVFSIIIYGCSKDISYKTLTFFFDGVPDTNSVKIKEDTLNLTSDAVTAGDLLKAPETNRVVHPPFKDKDCSICHYEGTFTLPQPKLCYQCHDDFATKYPFLHGPVAGGYCTACHHPHMGEKKLLLREGQDLCLHCHDRERVLKNESHDGIENTNCTECHNPHGGQERTMFN